MSIEVRADERSAVEWLERLRARDVSARELVDDVLARIAEVDPRLNAVVADRSEAARAEADAADAERARGGDRPLLGLPITVKDCLDVEGLPTSFGSFAASDEPAERDATTVGRLRAAGAIVVAKTNLPETSSSFETENARFGRTVHPLDPDRTPGGSSGGEAALIAAGASIAGVGTDGGGSIRVPSHYTGIVGIRPSTGRTPATGVRPPVRATGMGDLLCVGPMARRVEDLGLLLEHMAGADDIDPYAVPVPLGDWRAVDPAGLRVGFYDLDPSVPRTTAATRAAVRAAAERLAAAGAEVEETEPPDVAEATQLFFAAVGGDGGVHLKEAVAGAGGRHHSQFAALLEGMPETPPSAVEFFAVKARADEFRAKIRAWVNRYDVILAPVVAGPAPRHGEPPADIPMDEYFDYQGFNYVHTFAVAGLPAAAVPVGTEDGLPIGVQVVGRAFREDVALAAAAAIERAGAE